MRIRYLLTVFACLASLAAAAPQASAAPLYYTVDIDTSGLGGGLFGLDFQLNDGDGSGNGTSTVTLSNFDFGTGSTSGSAALTGGASGDALAGGTIVDSSFFNQFFQSFVAGGTISFDLMLDLNGPGAGPDLFTLAILDLDGTGFELPTEGPFGVELLAYEYGDAGLRTYGTADGAQFTVRQPTATPNARVPEPATLMLVGLGLVGVARSKWSRRQAGSLS